MGKRNKNQSVKDWFVSLNDCLRILVSGIRTRPPQDEGHKEKRNKIGWALMHIWIVTKSEAVCQLFPMRSNVRAMTCGVSAPGRRPLSLPH